MTEFSDTCLQETIQNKIKMYGFHFNRAHIIYSCPDESWPNALFQISS